MSECRERWGCKVERKGGAPDWELKDSIFHTSTNGDLVISNVNDGYPIMLFAAGTWVFAKVIYRDEK